MSNYQMTIKWHLNLHGFYLSPFYQQFWWFIPIQPPCPALPICSFRNWHPSVDALDTLSEVQRKLEAVLFPAAAGKWFSSNCFDLGQCGKEIGALQILEEK